MGCETCGIHARTLKRGARSPTSDVREKYRGVEEDRRTRHEKRIGSGEKGIESGGWEIGSDRGGIQARRWSGDEESANDYGLDASYDRCRYDDQVGDDAVCSDHFDGRPW